MPVKFKDTLESLSKSKKRKTKFEERARFLAMFTRSKFDYAYGDNPVLDRETEPCPSLDEEQVEKVNKFHILGKGYAVFVLTDEFDGEHDYLQVTASILDIDAINRNDLYADMGKAETFAREMGAMDVRLTETCEDCGGTYPEGGDGYMGKCPSCADKADKS
jgi:predicted Zn-ribbon and HTH transcriptional regulator